MKLSVIENGALAIVGLLVGTSLTACAGLLLNFHGWDGPLSGGIAGLSLMLMLLLGLRYMAWPRLLLFIAIGTLLGFWAEVFSLRYGEAFGCAYVYPDARWQDKVLGMPVSVALFWSVFIFSGYSMTNGLLFFMRSAPPGQTGGLPARTIPFLAMVDGWIVTAADVLMDPILVERGSWVWLQGGDFYGVPLGNFVGWFLISGLACGIFRWWETQHPQPKPQPRPVIALLPALAYAQLLLLLTTYAVVEGRPAWLLTGIFCMGPPIWISLLGFLVCGATNGHAKKKVQALE